MHIPLNSEHDVVDVAVSSGPVAGSVAAASSVATPAAAPAAVYTQPEPYDPAAGFGFGTNAVHAGQHPDPSTGAVIPPLSLSTTFRQSAVGVFQGFEYSRSDNPTRHAFEEAIAALEGGSHGLAFASGSAATATVMHALPKGSHVISINDVYGGTYRFFTKVANALGHDVTFIDLTNVDSLDGHFRENTKLVWIETPTNPTLRLADIAAVAERAHAHGVLVAVDNTFLSPYFQRPLSLGADLVVHSGTKYLNGHSDVVIGVAVTNDAALAERLRFLQNAIGAVPSAFDCFLANRGLKTLHVRMRQHERNALAVARALEAHPAVEQVIYPGLPSHPQHALAKRQQSGFGGMVTFRVRGELQHAERFLTAVKLFTLAESLGGVESLCELPSLMTHGSVAPEDRLKLGITDTLVRLSCGIEETDDLVADVKQALAVAVPEAIANTSVSTPAAAAAAAAAGLANIDTPIATR
ncbi:Cys/Met metabolism PLP-dependent enzyme-domain-containing protein [Thamnocephalis sphaerospora]|uniref:cystathionine gamma-lyase n=1 Tax=Thamnocephalis sphaerospora TaxID=78915 RepID=A0A4P9XUK3_9FUNG|nr:Cys/Met metabolism PLP-dependent enzyme-domain-containing protein [Thamnocephalis sphaerospora]|eukprot:RKP09642.1 Cys/Met metabolism PLP-dependent enzyme-domain-containing protein [Thamnocephalis sphaerospora]